VGFLELYDSFGLKTTVVSRQSLTHRLLISLSGCKVIYQGRPYGDRPAEWFGARGK
jgi:hypothetical protein